MCATNTIVVLYYLTAINRAFCCTASDVTIEHAVHHHGLDVVVEAFLTIILPSGRGVIAHKAGYSGTACNIGIAIAVDDTG